MKSLYFSFSSRLRVPGPKQPSTLWYSAVCCTRCNACVQSCPSYLLNREEIFSPRGRVQLLRTILEEKIKPSDSLRPVYQALQTCTLCTHCTQACAGQVPLAHQMLELQRVIKYQPLPASFRLLRHLYTQYPTLFEFILKSLLVLRQVGIISAFSFLLPKEVRHLHHILPLKTISLRKVLKDQTTISEQAEFVYLPSLITKYIDGHIAAATLQLMQTKNVHLLTHHPTGLFEYLYGTRAACLKQAKKFLRTWEQMSSTQKIPLLTDSIEQYGFLKNYPVLFANLPGWYARAQALAKHVKFLTDLPFPDGKTLFTNRSVGLDDSTILYPAGDIAERARKILLTKFDKNMIHCRYSRFPVPVAGRAFAHPAQSQRIVLAHVRDVAQHQLTDVYCLSGWAALELSAALRRYYPAAKARHFAYLQTDYERLSDGDA